LQPLLIALLQLVAPEARPLAEFGGMSLAGG